MRDFDFKICMFCCPWYLNKPEKVKSQFMNRKKQIAKLRFQSSLKHCLEKNYFFHASNCCWKNNGVCKQEALEFPIHFLCCCVVVQFWKLWKLQKAEFISENWKKKTFWFFNKADEKGSFARLYECEIQNSIYWMELRFSKVWLWPSLDQMV